MMFNKGRVQRLALMALNHELDNTVGELYEIILRAGLEGDE